jgi:very-short-patch-repair endonuclease
MTDSSMQRRVRAGRWERPYPGVYVVSGSRSSWMQDVWCAYLAVGSGAVITHETALHLHGIHMLPRWPITLTVPHGGHARLHGVFVHQIDDLKAERVAEIGAMPVSTVERTVVELSATRGSRELGKVADEVVVARKATYERIGACFKEVVRPGKPGMANLAEVLDARSDGYVPPHSELEAALFAALTAGGLPAPQRQFPLPGRGAINGLVDAAYIDSRVILEADGRRWHTRIDHLKRDHLRDTEAARAGWLTLRFLYEQIISDPGDVCAAVADVLAARQAPTGPIKPRS